MNKYKLNGVFSYSLKLFFITSVILLSACGISKDDIVGKWELHFEDDNSTELMEFLSDGTYTEMKTSGEQKGTWSLSDSQLELKPNDLNMTFSYEITRMGNENMTILMYGRNVEFEKITKNKDESSAPQANIPIIVGIILIVLVLIGTFILLSRKKALPYVVSVILLAVICGGGWWYYKNANSNTIGNTVDAVAEEVVVADTIVEEVVEVDATAEEATENDEDGHSKVGVIDYEFSGVNSGKFIFDAVLTDAALEKKTEKYVMEIDGNNVSIFDGRITMEGHFNEDFSIEASYDPKDDVHIYTLILRPNNREGSEWVGEYESNAIRYNVVLTISK